MLKTTGSLKSIDDVFKQYFSSVGPGVRPLQRKVIQSVIEKKNILALMPTGGGKSLCYWVAGKCLNGISLVIFPLTALMDEQALKLKNNGCNVLTLHSGINSREQYQELLDLIENPIKPDFIFMSPERLATDGFMEYVLQTVHQYIKLIVVDEAHCISQWGMDFRPFYKEIPYFLREIFGEFPLPPVLCLTATLNPKDQQQICLDFNIESKNIIKSDMLLRPTIDRKIIKVANEDEKDQKFWQLMDKHKNEKVLVYLDRKHGKRSTEALCEEAQTRGYRAAFFHADLQSEKKAEIIQKFKDNEIITVFATSAFGMGIDIPDIRGVVHYLITESTEQYYQQIGRVGRDGKPSWAVLFYSDKNVSVRRKDFIMKSFPEEKDIKKAFSLLTDDRTGRRTVNYFDEGDNTQSAYHYLVRSKVIKFVCKGVDNLNSFQPPKNQTLTEFDELINATLSKMLISVSKKTNISEPAILQKIYQWVANKKLVIKSAPHKCLVIDCLESSLPEELLSQILMDIEDKRNYRLQVFSDFVQILESYTSSMDIHKRIGEYLGIDRFSRDRVFQTLSGDLVRSKSEVIIANILFQSNIQFEYEKPLFAPNHTWRMPDFTIRWKGKDFYWEHLGMLGNEDYDKDWENKKKWYEEFFSNQLIISKETSTLSQESKQIIRENFL